MIYKIADSHDAPVIHEVMIQAFLYDKAEPTTLAVPIETADQIALALEGGEKAIIAFDEEDGSPVATVRFALKETDGVDFHQLSVLPGKQGQGIGKALLRFMEAYAASCNRNTVTCKVRMNAPRQIRLYDSIGYSVLGEELEQKPDGTSVPVVALRKVLQLQPA
ncbi:GNAT family N-acetyltransferase [Paenibacillus methanolicus]|uniref:Acetyltransferase (GNAT) family protein n=1 Tax=Paenibacillus methanolicus TaxID=582686 RepID=A0A5S5BS23_9BACL|nr:GNAT family N-acetyltransferase [Paenibacillus methanolicus]TYP69859.1 acetyltransferase (GNAT) family protein [Paenibacillus methanolicus]